MTNTISTVIPEITIRDNHAVTTSIAVANYFEKSHDNVLKKIRAIMLDCPPSYHAVNFNEMFQDVEVANGAVRKTPYFELTRDAFVLIVMGFTGKKALQWKIDYINAFNKMEDELRGAHQREEQRTPDYAEYTSRTLCYKRAGVTVNELSLREDDLIISMESWLDLARKNGWVVLRRDEAIVMLTEKIGGLMEEIFSGYTQAIHK
ncbi:Rha family transcriptional regulator [Cedecea sp.]|jgi:Rha family phage regulatory protein|uniref:Rha family transcriptional regulator n=1 Tax=Cedecea sp. TaxID=1970739 RepID=UPI002F3F7313